MIQYKTRSEGFHGNRARTTRATLTQARRDVNRHNQECECGGVHIVVSGSGPELAALGAYESEGHGFIVRLPEGYFVCEATDD